jgi:hypothetical protein
MPARITLLILAGAFLVSRAFVLGDLSPDAGDVDLYAKYGLERRQAALEEVPFYELHRAQRAAAGDVPAEQQIEYPPLAVAWLSVPAYLLPLPALGHGAHLFRARYELLYRAMMALVDAAIFMILILRGARAFSLSIYIVGGVLLAPLLYTRLDLLAGLLCLYTAIRGHSRAGLIALCAAIGFKLIPFVLLPIFVLQYPGRKRAVMLEAAFYLLLCFAPFVVLDGIEVFGFVWFHAAREAQLESWPALLSLWFGDPQVVARFGAHHVENSGAIAAVFSVVMLVAVTVFSYLTKRTADLPIVFIFFLSLSLSLSKVLSPQFMLLLLPLIPLAPPRISLLYLAAAAVTTAIFPYLYQTHLLRAGAGPDALGFALLFARNSMLVAIAALAYKPVCR